VNFYISDLHLGHGNALKFDSRPFTSVEEQNLMMIRNWNSVVAPGDTVYVLGDFAWKDDAAALFLDNTHGRKVLILGNHDKKSKIINRFDEVYNYLEIKDSGATIILSHYPIAHWKNADYGSIHLYGHIHNGRDSRPFEQYVYMMRNRVDAKTGLNTEYKAYNVGCMMPYMGYMPRTLAEIIRGDREYYAKLFSNGLATL